MISKKLFEKYKGLNDRQTDCDSAELISRRRMFVTNQFVTKAYFVTKPNFVTISSMFVTHHFVTKPNFVTACHELLVTSNRFVTKTIFVTGSQN